MNLSSILTIDRSLCRVPAPDKQQALESSARFIAGTTGLDANTLLLSLQARERLGSTGLGSGIAIPHCRLKNLDAVVGGLITLAEPIDFDAIDDAPVDILFVLLAPEHAMQQHLNTLAALAELFNQAAFRQQLRNATTAEQLFHAAVAFNS
ncbi:MAG TPA: PTS sugar transporter subunit IIA [Spongiibacteraceae bacterium]|nr:PTS sugar transporter subunit IIA [Spongiibacteraceae bacterium]